MKRLTVADVLMVTLAGLVLGLAFTFGMAQWMSETGVLCAVIVVSVLGFLITTVGQMFRPLVTPKTAFPSLRTFHSPPSE